MKSPPKPSQSLWILFGNKHILKMSWGIRVNSIQSSSILSASSYQGLRASGVIIVAAVTSQRERKQSVDCGCEDKPYSGEIFTHQTKQRPGKYQDQYQIWLLCAPRFQRKTEEEEKGFVWGEKVLEFTPRNGCLATQSRVHGPAAPASFESIIKTQNLRPHLRDIESKSGF